MRRLLLGLMLVSQVSWAANTSVLHVSGDTGGASPHSTTITATTAGNGLVVCGELVDNTKVISGITCGSNTLVQGTSCKSTNATTTTAVDCWYKSNASSCSSVSTTATANIGAVVTWEISNGALTDGTLFDVCGVANSLASASTLTGPSMTTAAGGETILCMAADSNNCTSVDAPYGGFLGENGHGSGSQSSASIISASAPIFHDSSSGGGNISCIAVKPTIAGSSSTGSINTKFGTGNAVTTVGTGIVTTK